jgi:hypothetical protein
MVADLLDTAFSDALWRARAGFRGAELRRGADGSSADLIAWLQSDRPLPDDAGDVLAAYFAGVLARGRGRHRAVNGDDFATVARRAAMAYSRYASEVRGAAKSDSASLIEILHSVPLTRLSRDYLAEFISGQMHPAGGKTWGVRKNQDDRALGADIAEHKATLARKGVRTGLAEEEAIAALKKDTRAIRRKPSVLKKLMHATGKIRRIPNVKR